MEEALSRIRLEDRHLLRALSNILYTMHMTCMMTDESHHCAMVTMHFAGTLAREMTSPSVVQALRREKERCVRGVGATTFF